MNNIERIDSAPGYMAGYSSATDYRINQACTKAAMVGATEEQFRQACKARNVDALTPWAPAHYPKLSDVLEVSLDFTTGPQIGEVFQILIDVAYGSVDGQPAKARDLLRRMAEKYAEHYAPEVE